MTVLSPTATTNILDPSPRSCIHNDYSWEACRPPSVNDAALALTDLRTLLKSHNPTIHSDGVLRTRLDHLDRFLAFYTAGRGWIKAADYTAAILGQGTGCSRRLRSWGKDFICNWSVLPYHNYANSGSSSILDDVDFVEELQAHITDIGAHISAQAIVDFMKKPEVAKRHRILKPITLDTTHKWMSKLNFAWRQTPKGTYLDGHEQPDVVHYCQNIYLPTLTRCEPALRVWDKENTTHLIDPSLPSPTCHSILWFNDQCIFYQNDRQKCFWVHASEKPIPLPKGEGVSLMVSDFISADYGWLRSPDGTESAWVLFQPGANREGYLETGRNMSGTLQGLDHFA